ncbi:hypothetical protein J6590_003966 [Homalodisca vitripennis]|nr:hypothetical protein J6590_003966 [Homalodisca vitripennis]
MILDTLGTGSQTRHIYLRTIWTLLVSGNLGTSVKHGTFIYVEFGLCWYLVSLGTAVEHGTFIYVEFGLCWYLNLDSAGIWSLGHSSQTRHIYLRRIWTLLVSGQLGNSSRTRHIYLRRIWTLLVSGHLGTAVKHGTFIYVEFGLCWYLVSLGTAVEHGTFIYVEFGLCWYLVTWAQQSNTAHLST